MLSCCRTLDMSSEDLFALAYWKFDIEAWMPGLCRYGEVCSSTPKLCFWHAYALSLFSPCLGCCCVETGCELQLNKPTIVVSQFRVLWAAIADLMWYRYQVHQTIQIIKVGISTSGIAQPHLLLLQPNNHLSPKRWRQLCLPYSLYTLWMQQHV